MPQLSACRAAATFRRAEGPIYHEEHEEHEEKA
jgi:hypothetical protein